MYVDLAMLEPFAGEGDERDGVAEEWQFCILNDYVYSRW